MKVDISEEIRIPEEVNVEVENGLVKVSGPSGDVEKEMREPRISISVEDDLVILSSEDATKSEKKRVNTLRARIENMLFGAKEGHTYKLKACSSHFPMTVSIDDGKLVVENFIGESTPRELDIDERVSVEVDGEEIIIESADKELAGNTASQMELLTDIKGKDRRIFQDGIYIVEKSEGEL